MTWSTTVHTPLSSDTEPSILVTFDNAKYVFNATENTGRAFLQGYRNWKKARALFFTQASVERTSGVAGLIMTFADATIDKLALLGPPGLTHILASARMYTFRDSIDIQPKDIPWSIQRGPSPEPCYSDSNIAVYAIPVLPLVDSASEGDRVNLPEKRKRDPSPDSPRKRSNPGTSEYVSSSSLTGKPADDYRQSVLRAMFPYTNAHPPMDAARRADARHRSLKGIADKKMRDAGITPPPLPENLNIDIDTQRRSRGSLPNGFHKQLPSFIDALPPSTSHPALSYLVVGPRYRGKFVVEKAEELGVAKRDRGRLAKGETITFQVKEGDELVERTVKPEDVLEPSEDPAAILILDVPSPAHIPSLVSAIKDSEFYRKIWSDDGAPSPDSKMVLRAIYHLCGEQVLEDEDYKTFLKGFGPEVDHMVASRDHCPDPITFTSAAYNQLRLNKLDEKMFPILKYSLSAKTGLSTVPNLPRKVQPMRSGLHLVLRPYTPPTADDQLSLDKFHPVASGEVPLIFSAPMQSSVEGAKAKVAHRLETGEFPRTIGEDVSVIPLGTGGSLPSKYRNVLSTLIRIPGWGNILLDTGEGTWGQLARNYGLEDSEYNAWQALRDVKCIFVSHIHGDHHIGLAHLLAKRRLLNPPPDHPVYIVSVRAVHLYLRELSDVQDLGLFDPSGNGVVSVLNETMHDRATGQYMTTGMWQVGGDESWLHFGTSVDNGRKMCEALGLEYFKTVDVYHRCRCFGCAFKHKDGWSISFSGDTAPTDSLVRIGMNSTVCIHEATMADDEADMAQQKAHSTIGQAIAIGRKMNAKHTVLTHFSARHPKLPPSAKKETMSGDSDSKNLVLPAFDHANMRIGDMWKMAHYLPAILFSIRETEFEEGEEIRSRSSSPTPSSSKNANSRA